MNKTKYFENRAESSPSSIKESRVYLEALKSLQTKNEKIEKENRELLSNQNFLQKRIRDLEEKITILNNNSKSFEPINNKFEALNEHLSFVKEELSKEITKNNLLQREKSQFKQSFLELKKLSIKLEKENQTLREKLKAKTNKENKERKNAEAESNFKENFNNSTTKFSENFFSKSKCISFQKEKNLSEKPRKALAEIINSHSQNWQKEVDSKVSMKNQHERRNQEFDFELKNNSNRNFSRNQSQIFRIDSSLFDSSSEEKVEEQKLRTKEPGKVRKRCLSMKYISCRN